MRNKKNIIMVVMCIAVFVMAVGYAIFQTNLNIGATGNITTTWGIAITNITSSITGDAVNITDPTYTGVNATFNAGFYKPGDKIEYSITVSNTGNIDAIISDVIINTSGSSDIIYTVKDLEKNTELPKKSNITFKITTEFDINVKTPPAILEKNINIVLSVVQSDGINPTPVAPDITDTTTQWGIMYVANGGSGSMEGTICTVGQSCTLSDNSFTRNGYKFMGWSTTPTGEVEYTNGQTVTDLTTKGKTQTLYAVWFNFIDIILNDNIAQPDTNIDFNKPTEEGTNGLYYTSINTEDDKTVYYFRGNVENNYVKFGKHSDGNDILWRIVRINEDGSIRIVTQDSVGNSAFNAKSGDNAYVGYMYGTTGSSTYEATHSNTNDSTIKTFIDDWYINKSNLNNYSNLMSTEAGFCNDRSIAPRAKLWSALDTALGYGQNITDYGLSERNPLTPQFKCPNATRDLFTVSSSIKGNKKLNNPVGLLTYDEVMYAGVVKNDGTYLNVGKYWTMSPSHWGGSTISRDHAWIFLVKGSLSNEISSYGVRPVINLKPTVELSTNLPSGCTELDGTQACPYIIDTSV